MLKTSDALRYFTTYFALNTLLASITMCKPDNTDSVLALTGYNRFSACPTTWEVTQIGFFEKAYAVVRTIPPGYVMSYGRVAALAGNPRMARQVGWALHALKPGHNVPWQRVVNKVGRVSPWAVMGADNLQKILLESEGVCFDDEGHVEKKHFL